MTTKTASARQSTWQLTNLLAMAGVILLVVALLLVGYKLARIGYFGWQAYQNGMVLLDTARYNRTPEALAQNQPELAAVADALAGLEREVAPLTPLLRRLDGVTPYGSTLAALPELLTVGAEMSSMGSEGLLLVGPAFASEGELTANLAAAVAEGDGQAFVQMAQQARRANSALLAVEADGLLPQLSGPVAMAQELSPLMAPGLQLGPALPDLLGMNRPMTYLVLVQNNQELRGTGGWITGVGVLKVERGRIVSLDFSDSYALDNHAVDHPPAPREMQKYMGIPLLFLRDANWSPDLPTAARTAHNLYKRDWGVEVDGVVTVDLRAVELIIGGIGPVQMEGVEEPITGENVLEIIVQLWASPNDASADQSWQDWWSQRKDFMPALASAVLEKIKSGRFNYFGLLRAGRTAMNERAIQIWLKDPLAQEQLTALKWDGALHPQPGADYLALVDSNVGYNKVDAVIERRLDYAVTWPDDPEEPALATATVTYRHPVESPGHVCDQTPRYGDTRADLMKRCYFDYVRLYVPRGSQLVGIDGVQPDSVSSRRAERNTQALAGYFEMKPGTTHTVTFRYHLPPTLGPQGYRLVVQRQSGAGPLPVGGNVAGQTFSATITDNLFIWPR